jgi:hypothetical protein
MEISKSVKPVQVVITLTAKDFALQKDPSVLLINQLVELAQDVNTDMSLEKVTAFYVAPSKVIMLDLIKFILLKTVLRLTKLPVKLYQVTIMEDPQLLLELPQLIALLRFLPLALPQPPPQPLPPLEMSLNSFLLLLLLYSLSLCDERIVKVIVRIYEFA